MFYPPPCNYRNKDFSTACVRHSNWRQCISLKNYEFFHIVSPVCAATGTSTECKKRAARSVKETLAHG